MLTLHPIIPIWAIVLIFLPLVVLAGYCAFKRTRARGTWVRRIAMILLLALIALRPVTMNESEAHERMNANIIFVVDRTGSMSAEDYNGTQPRIDGVKGDIAQIMDMTKGARYGIVSFDSSASTQLPMTTDAGAVKAWVDTLDTETTKYSKGSNVDRPRVALTKMINETRAEDPKSHVFVYFMSDGENTDNKESETFGEIKGLIDGGGVLGYGTAAGGRMKVNGGSKAGQYIQDPAGGDGKSKIDEANLRKIAEQMGVAYYHRTTPGEDLKASLNGHTLHAIPSQEKLATPSFEDWYWIPAIIFNLLALWELVAFILRFPKKLERGDFTAAGRQV